MMPVSLNSLVTFRTVIILSALSSAIVCIYLRRRRVVDKQGENRGKIQQNQMLPLYDAERRMKDLIGSDHFKEDDKKGIDVPFFDLRSILAATNNFSDANIIGRGNSRPVYKGKFPGGQEIAVKRLLLMENHRLKEFYNELILIAKLKHWNFVRLLGYCVNEDENILLYEYMPNKSLDFFIFDQMQRAVLDWELCFNIILGIARGLLYLHQDSKLKIIHRDLKPSSILLDAEMNPKISVYGFAKIFARKRNEKTTNVIGTFGYMPPEYQLSGLVSVKTDVFSFGVLVLEIMSGKRNWELIQFEESEGERNADSNQFEGSSNLLDYAWRLWSKDNALDLMDQTLRKTCSKNEVLKCINVGLLCVENKPSDRPTMSDVVFMLDSGTTTLPTPKQPAFTGQRGSSSATSSNKLETCSENELTVTIEESP